MSRVSEKTVRSLFPRFCAAIGGRVASSYNDVGGLQLDYNPIYGGFVINEVSNSGGGVCRPFGMTRRKPADMLSAMNFAMDCMRYDPR